MNANATTQLKLRNNILDSKGKTKTMKALISVLLLVSLLALACLGEAAPLAESVAFCPVTSNRGKIAQSYSFSDRQKTKQIFSVDSVAPVPTRCLVCCFAVVAPSEIVGWWHLKSSNGKYSVSKTNVTRQPKLSVRATVHGSVSKDISLYLVF
jgi:hypothetical protein